MLFAGIGFFIAILGGFVPQPIGQFVTLVGMGIMFVGSILSTYVLEWMARNTDCLQLQLDNNGITFYAYLKKPPELEIDPKTKTSHWRCYARWPVTIPDDEYYGPFEEFVLESDIPLGERLSWGKRMAVLMGIYMEPGHVAPLLIEVTEASPSDSYKGKRIPAFKVKWAIQGDKEHNRTMLSSSLLGIIDHPNKSLSQKCLALLKVCTKQQFTITQLRQGKKHADQERLKDDLAGDTKDATSEALIEHQKDFATAVKIFVIHQFNFHKSWGTLKSIFVDGKFKFKLTWMIVALATLCIGGFVLGTNPQMVVQLQYLLAQPQNQMFIVVLAVIALAVVYFLWKRRE